MEKAYIYPYAIGVFEMKLLSKVISFLLNSTLNQMSVQLQSHNKGHVNRKEFQDIFRSFSIKICQEPIIFNLTTNKIHTTINLIFFKCTKQ